MMIVLEKVNHAELNTRFQKLCIAGWVFSWIFQFCVQQIDKALGFNFISVIPFLILLLAFWLSVPLAWCAVAENVKSERSHPILNLLPILCVALSALVVIFVLARLGLYTDYSE